jgi:hypothetical protein
MTKCIQHHQFRRAYEIAARRCGQVTLPLPDHCSLSLSALNQAVKDKAFAERNAAKLRLDAHEQTCSICTPKGELVGAH